MKIGIRNLLRHKTFSLINILGLAIGMACVIFILLWVQDELLFDQFHKKGDHLYRVMREKHYTEGAMEIKETTPALLAPALIEEIPEIVEAARFIWEEVLLFKVGEKRILEKGRYADGSLFKMFSFPLIAGNPENALENSNSIAISESLAKKYFGEQNAIGNMITVRQWDEDKDFVVTGIFEDIPRASSLRFDYVIPIEEYLRRNKYATHWGNNSFRTYIQLNAIASHAEVEERIKNFGKDHYEYADYELFLQPYKEMYLYSNFHGGGRIEYVRLFLLVALFVLLIACVNFITLSTARSFTRAHEVGIKKVVGANRQALIRQFMGESVFITLIATVLALTLVEFFMPQFNQLTSKSLNVPYSNPVFMLTIASVFFFVSFLSGSYPSFFLSSYSPVKVLKGNLFRDSGRSSIRKGLIVFQFAVSVVLTVCTLIVNGQIRFIKKMNLGIERENLIQFPIYGGIEQHREAFRNELTQMPGIKSVTFAGQNPFSVSTSTTDPKWEGKRSDDEIKFNVLFTDYDLIETLNIQLKEGRGFSRDMSTDGSNFIINEEAARQMRIQNPLSTPLSFWRGEGRIIGILKDFHFHSIHTPIEPFIMMLWPENTNLGYLKTETGRTIEAIKNLRKVYKKHEPDYPFEYTFVDQDYEQMYRSEIIMGKLVGYFTFFAVFISCLGLYGLASFSTVRRTKEIGVRKVLGASVTHIIALLSKDFTKWILLANLLAWPVAYFAMNRWLQNFAYRINISWWMFILAGSLALVIALLTVSYQAIRAALANPVQALRHE